MAQPGVELARGFGFGLFAVAEELDSVLKLSGSGRRLFEPANGLQQLPYLVLVELFYEQGLLRALVLQSYLVVRTICFSASVHPASPLPSNLISLGTL
jgi:hypothetical protein